METDFKIILIGTAGMLIVVIAMFVFAYFYQKKITKKKQDLASIRDLLHQEELKSAYALIEGQDQERERIAQDLHDSMGGQLSTVKIYLDLLEKTSLSDKQSALIKKLQGNVDTSIKEVRAIAHDLSSSTLVYFGLPKALKQLCEVINDSKRIEAKLYDSITTDIPKDLARAIYHMIQELMTNTLRHAEATTIRVDLTTISDELSLIYHDNGKGFAPSQNNTGLGIKGIRLRVAKYNGNLHIESGKEGGTTFIIEIPIDK